MLLTYEFVTVPHPKQPLRKKRGQPPTKRKTSTPPPLPGGPVHSQQPQQRQGSNTLCSTREGRFSPQPQKAAQRTSATASRTHTTTTGGGGTIPPRGGRGPPRPWPNHMTVQTKLQDAKNSQDLESRRNYDDLFENSARVSKIELWKLSGFMEFLVFQLFICTA